MKTVIVGGVAGGASAAARLRRLDEQAEIVMLERGPYISFANCGLPYYIGGEITKRSALTLQTPESFRSRFNVDVRVNQEAVAVDTQAKTVTVRRVDTGEEYTESYDKLLLSPGAAPLVPPMEGADDPRVFTLRNIPDTVKIRDYVDEEFPETAVVVGGGYIGVEMAENLQRRGLDVTIVEFADQVVASLDPEMAQILHRHLTEHGVSLRLKTGLAGIAQVDTGLQVELSDGSAIESDLVLLSIGVSPENKLAKEAGLHHGVGNSIAVSASYQTSDPNIYAVGDAIGVTHLVSGKETLVPLAGPANKQGRLAAENALGGHQAAQPVQGSSVLKAFDLTAASTGLNEKQAKALGLSYRKTYIHPQSHASYYPGATPISMKMLFDGNGAILGAQAVGYEGVEKRIDVLATAIRLHGTVYDLEELELCYAPPFSSAKDPVNMLGFTAANILKGDMPVYYAEDIPGLSPEGTTRLDVSTPAEFGMSTIPGYQNIPLDELRGRLSELDPNKPVYVTCRVGLRGYLATRILKQHGFDAYNLSGGMKTYQLVRETES